MAAETDLQEYAERGQENGDDDTDDVHDRGPLVKGSRPSIARRTLGIGGLRCPVEEKRRFEHARITPPSSAWFLRPDRRTEGIIGAGMDEWKWRRSDEHTSELQSLMRISYAVFCLKHKTIKLYKLKSKNIT